MVLALAALLAFSACGETDDSTDGDADGDDESAADGDEAPDGDDTPDGDETSDGDAASDGDETTDGDADGCGTAAMLEGTWLGDEITLEIAADLSYHAVGVNDVGYDVTGNAEVEGCVVKLTETAGALACPAEQVGEYEFVVTETTLTFTLVSDACQGRVMGIDGKTFQKQ